MLLVEKLLWAVCFAKNYDTKAHFFVWVKITNLHAYLFWLLQTQLLDSMYVVTRRRKTPSGSGPSTRKIMIFHSYIVSKKKKKEIHFQRLGILL